MLGALYLGPDFPELQGFAWPTPRELPEELARYIRAAVALVAAA